MAAVPFGIRPPKTIKRVLLVGSVVNSTADRLTISLPTAKVGTVQYVTVPWAAVSKQSKIRRG